MSFLERTAIAMTPQGAARLIKKGASLLIEDDLGIGLHYSNEDYTKVGARIVSRDEVLKTTDMILRVRKPSSEDASKIKSGAIHVSFLDPFNEKDLINALARQGVSAISLEMIPRTTIAQKWTP